MTVIAWDGKTLAADKMACSVGYGYTVTKVHRLSRGGIAAFSGDGDGAMALLHWLEGTCDPAAYPVGQKDNETSALVIDPDGVVWSWGTTPYPQRVEGRFYAMGHGRDFALAAMHLGKTAREAVEVACALDVYCGNGIDTLELHEQA
jgi:ATP-dependent protease HslVU (ClpYQ) peptidase subunit